MDDFTKKTFTTSRSLTYTYYDSATANPVFANEPTLLLLHGFPDSAHLWHKVVPYLRSLPHRILLPDLLGFGGTSKPTDSALFQSSGIASDLAEILAAEGVKKTVVIGHDWGSFLAQRVWLWKPELCVGIALLNVAYVPPSAQPFDLAAMNMHFEETTGYPLYAYWEFFVADDGAKIVDEHLDSFWAVLHGNQEHWMRDKFCVRNAMRKFLENDEVIELKEYAKPGNGWKEEWFESVRRGGGLTSAMCSYKAMVNNLNYEVEKTLPSKRIPITVPTLFIGCSGDEVCLPRLIEENKQAGLLPDLTVKVIDSGHWCPMEKPEEVGQALFDFVSERFSTN